MKRKLALLLVFALVLSFIPAISVSAADTTTATITFDDTAKRTVFETSQQVWVENGITVTNDKASSSSNIGNYSNPARFYKNSTLTVAYPAMTKIEITCSSDSYATTLGKCIDGAAVSDKVVTVEFAEPTDSYTATMSSGQVRVSSLTVTANVTTTDPTEPATEPTEPATEPTEPATEATEPATEPTEPATEATEPTTEPASGTGYTKITSLDELTTGKYVMVLSNGYAPTVLDGNWILSGAPTVNGDTITEANAAGYIWDLTVDGTSVVLTDANGVSIAPKSGNTNGIQSGTYSWAVTCTDGTFQFAGTGEDTTVLAANTGSDSKLRAYKTSTVSGNANGYPSYFTLYKLVEETAEAGTALVGTSYSIRLIEPWALRTFITFATGDAASPAPIKLADITSYGAYAIIEHKFDNAETATVEDLIADTDTVAYTSAAGDIYPGGADETTTVVFDFTDELYTYRLGEKVYWVAYYVDANGQTYYTTVKSTTIVAVADTVSGQTNVSEEEKAVLSCMKVLKQAVIDFRGENANLGNTDYADGVALEDSGIAFGQGGEAGKYLFGNSHQIRLIEPWSIRVKLYIQDAAAGAGIDYTAENVNYGMIFYHDKAGTYADGMSVEQIIAKGDAQVYSSSTNNLEMATDHVIATYDKGIYTYELDTNLYCLPYVEVDGVYYYRSSVICWNLLTQMNAYAQDTTLSAEEIAVFNAMIDLHEKTLAYRNK